MIPYHFKNLVAKSPIPVLKLEQLEGQSVECIPTPVTLANIIKTDPKFRFRTESSLTSNQVFLVP